MSDVIGDFINRLMNAGAVKKATVSLPYSSYKAAIAEKLKDAGYVKAIEKRGKKVKKTLEVFLKYSEDGSPAIRGAKRVSKPGRRLYSSVRDIKPVKYGRGALILSTPKGIMTDTEAKKANIGGEALFEIW